MFLNNIDLFSNIKIAQIQTNISVKKNNKKTTHLGMQNVFSRTEYLRLKNLQKLELR